MLTYGRNTEARWSVFAYILSVFSEIADILFNITKNILNNGIFICCTIVFGCLLSHILFLVILYPFLCRTTFPNTDIKQTCNPGLSTCIITLIALLIMAGSWVAMKHRVNTTLSRHLQKKRGFTRYWLHRAIIWDIYEHTSLSCHIKKKMWQNMEWIKAERWREGESVYQLYPELRPMSLTHKQVKQNILFF